MPHDPNPAARAGSLKAFLAARDYLLAHREDYEKVRREFRWPHLTDFNWALDYFDGCARENSKPALWIIEDDAIDLKLSFAEMSRRSNQVANFLRRHGVRRGDRIIVMLPNVVAIWEVMLAAMKLGAIVVPAATLLTESDLRDRLVRGKAKHVIAFSASTPKFGGLEGAYTRIAVGPPQQGWISYQDAYSESPNFAPDAVTRAEDPFLLYFTSGTTALPKLVLHTHQSYPAGHLATMYWIGLRPDDIHLNISSPGWAKHAWSCFFAPWNAGATIFIHNYARFDAKKTLGEVARCGVSTMCAPPTVWRMCVLEDLKSFPVKLRDLASAGEPLNPEIIEKIRAAWDITIRDGFGQTENVCLLGNFPGQKVKPGSVGKPSPGHEIALLDADGYFTYVGRADDVFKSSDYRLSPFELESALIEHSAVAEAAVVPSPDEIRWTVPKAFITLKPGYEPTRELAR
jgi:acetyl-CoA synthetase